MEPTLAPSPKPFCQPNPAGGPVWWWVYWYFTIFSGLSILMGGGIGGCASSNRPTPAQCDAAYQTAVIACNVFTHDTQKQAQCLAAAEAGKLVCMVWAESGSQDQTRGAKSAGGKETKLAEVYELVRDGKMSGDAAREYIFGKT